MFKRLKKLYQLFDLQYYFILDKNDFMKINDDYYKY